MSRSLVINVCVPEGRLWKVPKPKEPIVSPRCVRYNAMQYNTTTQALCVKWTEQSAMTSVTTHMSSDLFRIFVWVARSRFTQSEIGVTADSKSETYITISVPRYQLDSYNVTDNINVDPHFFAPLPYNTNDGRSSARLYSWTWIQHFGDVSVSLFYVRNLASNVASLRLYDQRCDLMIPEE